MMSYTIIDYNAVIVNRDNNTDNLFSLVRKIINPKIFVLKFVRNLIFLTLILSNKIMSKVSFSPLAYCKMVGHAAKYPHCEVNGLLIADNATKGDKLVITDVVPLFHQCLHVSPMSEIALTQIDQSASSCDMYIAGYYLANETLDDLSYDKPAHKIMDKIAENETDVCMVVINNRLMEINQKESALIVHTQQDDGKWKRLNNSNVQIENTTLAAASAILQKQLYNNLIDFDNHLDNLSLDFLNTEFANWIEKTSGLDMGRKLVINKLVS